MTRKQRRLILILIAGAVLALAAALVLVALKDTIVFFNTPTDIVQKPPAAHARLRLGGLVEHGTVRRDGAVVEFQVTDGKNKVLVKYEGLLPDLFREGQGVVTEGRLESGVFIADKVLAKHDETYMPKEVADALKQRGVWKGEAPR